MFDMILVYLSQIDFLCKIIPRQIKAENAVRIIRNTVEELIMAASGWSQKLLCTPEKHCSLMVPLINSSRFIQISPNSSKRIEYEV